MSHRYDDGIGVIAARPLDARLARRLVRPLVGSRATPNHLTTLRLLLGLAAAGGLAHGGPGWANIGALAFVLSNLVDHADGELARVSGAASRLGHCYDLACDVLLHVLLFAALGYGLRAGALGYWAALLGLVAGAGVALIFWLHMRMTSTLGRQRARLPATRLFEIEDVLYLLPLVTLFDVRTAFLTAAAVGAPAFAFWLGARFARRAGPAVQA